MAPAGDVQIPSGLDELPCPLALAIAIYLDIRTLSSLASLFRDRYRYRLFWVAPTFIGDVYLRASNTAKAILTDSHFWIPVAALAFGVILLMGIR